MAEVEDRTGEPSVDYYDSEENVEQYIQMASGYDGKLLIDALRAYLPRGAKALELGMGPGKDLLLLKDRYRVTGSDGHSFPEGSSNCIRT